MQHALRFNMHTGPKYLLLALKCVYIALVASAFIKSPALALDAPSFLARQDYAPSSGHAAFIGDFSGDGFPDLVVLLTGFCTRFGNGDGSFTDGPCSAEPITDTLIQTAVIDTNRDGKLDVVYSLPNQKTIGVALGNGDGTFQAAVVVPQLSGQVFTLGDFNGDGNVDVAAVDQDSGTLGVSLGNGDGTFSAARTVSLMGAMNLSAADLNRDGKDDLLISTSLGTDVWLSNGDGAFTPGQVIPLGCANHASAASADFNGDGLVDVAIGCIESPNQGQNYLALFLNQGNGTVRISAVATVNQGIEDIAVGDVNGDGVPDIAVAGALGIIYVLPGVGDGSFGETYGCFSSSNPIWLTLSDLRRDGTADVITYNGGAFDLSVILNDGKGKFADGIAVDLPQAYQVFGGSATDIDGDGYLDVVAGTNAGLEILYGTGRAAAPFRHGAVLTAGRYFTEFPAVGDVNNDGINDVVVSVFNGKGTWKITVFLGQGNGAFGMGKTYDAGPFGLYLGPLILCDLNGDGKLDIVATAGSMLGNGDGTFQPFYSFNTRSLITNGFGTLPPTVADFNGDGILDVATYQALVGESNNYAKILLGNGDGTFRAFPVMPYYGNFLLSGDFNQDGIPDLVVAGQYADFVLLLGNGDGAFRLGSSVTPLVGMLPYIGVAADFNGDGNLDLATVNNDGGTCMMLLGNGDGTFSNAAEPLIWGTGPDPIGVLAGIFHEGATSTTQDLVTIGGTGRLSLLPNITNK